MRTLILYYSVTGHTRKIAQSLAGQLDATLGEITCKAYTSGLGALRQAFDVLRGGSPPIEIPKCAMQDWDLVVIGGPVWGARPATPIRSYLRHNAARHVNLAVFVSCKGTSRAYPPERAIAELRTMVPRPLRATQIFTEAQIDRAGAASEIAGFAAVLRKPA